MEIEQSLNTGRGESDYSLRVTELQQQTIESLQS